jgi:glycosyltransferase involved in cell wall biosynthesis
VLKRNPYVSAVIPTRNRPELVTKAVRSVFAQTFQDVECVVVIDGPDVETVAALEALDEPRLKIIALKENVGGSEARNVGARNASGEWLALLDDDDEWLSNRLERQLEAVENQNSPVTMVASQFLDRDSKTDIIRPRKFPHEGQPISDFLWCEVSPLGGIEGFPQTSTWLIQRSFFLETPFTKGLKALQDLDWLLKAYSDPRMCVLFVREPLTVFNNEKSRERITKKIDWQFSYEWGMKNLRLFTPKSFAFFLVIFCVNPASRQGAAWAVRFNLLKDCFRFGRVTPKLLVLYFLYTAIYPILGKILSPRTRSVLLYRLKTLWGA